MADQQQPKTLYVAKNEGDFFGGYDDRAEDRTVSSRAQLRDELSDQVRDFLAGGGQISQVEPLVRADPPRRPDVNYGRGPI